MSDSYAKLCEEREQNERLFSQERVDEVKKTAAFKKLLEKAKAACKSGKLSEAKSCGNCRHHEWMNSSCICKKLGLCIDEMIDSACCEHWRGTVDKLPLKPDEDVLAWTIIDKSKQ